VARIFEPIHKRPSRPAWTGSARRQPSSLGPVAIPARAADLNGGTVNGTPPAQGVEGADGTSGVHQ
jgi:cell division protease FtsH